jgi:hypothetical protein
MLSIAIILGIGIILNIIQNKGDYNTLMASALCISLFALNLVVFVVVLSLLVVIGIGATVNKKGI